MEWRRACARQLGRAEDERAMLRRPPLRESTVAVWPGHRRNATMAFELPPLPYDYSALEPYIDEQTMHLHHDKHHQAYVTNLNNALQGQSQFENLPIEELIRRINEVPESIRTAVRNNGGGHLDHSLVWHVLKPNGGRGAAAPVARAPT